MSTTTRTETPNTTAPHMGLLTSWKQRLEEKRARQLAKVHSDEIDRQIWEHKKTLWRKATVLLMSIPEYEAETFTLIKGMVLNSDYSSEELANYRPVIWKVLLENSHSLVQAIRTRSLGLAPRANTANCEGVMNHRTDTDNPNFLFLPEFAQAIQDLWVKEIVPMLLERPSCLSLDDHAAYIALSLALLSHTDQPPTYSFFAEAHRIVADDYIPSKEDIIHASQKGAMETYLTMGQTPIRILQVYGQQNERRKWIHLFESVTSIVFYTSFCDYDGPQNIDRDLQLSRMVKSSVLFEQVVNSRWFFRTSIVLFLVGYIEFGEKLHRVPLDRYFPEYSGGTDASKGAKYILWRFMQANRQQLNIYPHITEATAVSNLRLLFIAVKETILRDTIRGTGCL